MPRYFGKICAEHPELAGERRNGNCPACQRQRTRPKRSRESQRLKVSKWRAGNRERYLAGAHARSAVRRARKKGATGEDSVAIRRAFMTISRKARRLGLVVDHIVPLAPCRVCGAQGPHEPSNWHLMSAALNSAKGNRCEFCWRTPDAERNK
jgi:hypothetical protein